MNVAADWKREMILHWDQVPLYYGSELVAHRHRFAQAAQSTYALLCCRLTPGNDRMRASGGAHAEEKLLQSDLWTDELPRALAAWSPLSRGRIVVTMLVSRTPCRTCTDALVQALVTLQWNHPASFPHARFILACRGAYQGCVTDSGYYGNATTVGGLTRLGNAGWELCVLQVGDTLPRSGSDLLQAIRRLSGGRTSVKRLADV